MIRRNYLIIWILPFLFLASCNENKQSESTEFPKTLHLPVQLNQLDSSDLHPILNMVGEAKIIGLSEANHYMNEPLDFRNELIKFLVRQKRVDVIALESGILESRYLFNYVNGQSENIDSILFKGLSWTFDNLPQNKSLIEWLRNYNSDATNAHKVKLYGFDIPGSPLNPFANQRIDLSLTTSLEYLKIVDHDNWVELNSRLQPILAYIHLNISKPDVNQYFHLTAAERNELTSIVDDLTSLFQTNELKYIQRTSEEDYRWANLAAISAKHMDEYLSIIPVNFELSNDISKTIFSNFFWELHGKRDAVMAQNVEWIRAHETNANMFLFGHINHISKSDQTLVLEDSTKIKKAKQLGQYLDSTFGDDYLAIGNFNFETKRLNRVTQADDDSVEKLLAKQDSGNYFHLVSEKDREKMNYEWKVGESFLGAKTYMNPSQGIDIIFFNPLQTEITIE